MSLRSLIFIVSIIPLTISFSILVPIFEFPDEQAHIESVEFLAANDRMPAGDEWDMTPEMAETQKYLGVYRDHLGNNKVTYHPEYRVEYTDNLVGKYEQEIIDLKDDRGTYVNKEAARYPRLYYDYIGLWYQLVESSDIILRTYVMRIGNVMLALATAIVVYFMGLKIFRNRARATTLTLLVMLQPMYTFLSAGINSDNLHNFLFATLIYCGVLIIEQGITRNIFVATISVLLLDLLTKPQAYIALPILLVAFLIHIVTHKKWKLLKIMILGGIAAIALVVSPLNPYRSWVLSANTHKASFIEFARFSLNKLVAQNIVWYWGVYKWLGVVLPPIYWQVANRIVVVGGVGLAIYLWRVVTKRKVVVPAPMTIYLLFTAIIYAAAIYYFDWQYVKAVGYSIGVQARYLFPTISTHMALLMVGIISLGWNDKVKVWLSRGLVIFIIWLQLGGIWRIITSYYDVTSLHTFIIQVSQYKPWFAKGGWWYLWIGLYLLSILYIFWRGFIRLPHQNEPKGAGSSSSSLTPQKYAPRKRMDSERRVAK